MKFTYEEIEQLRDELEALTKRMDVPDFRRVNIGWLYKNLKKRNQNHEDFEKAMEIVQRLRKAGVN